MRFATLASSLALVFGLTLACGEGVQGNPSGNKDGGGGSPDGGGGGHVLCGNSNPCPSGQFCFNGLCAYGCNSNGDCAADQYCDTSQYGDRLCHNKTVTTCPGTPCESNQVCEKGMCSTPPPATQCDPAKASSGQDGCDKYSICLQDDQSNPAKCYTFDACPQDGHCPTGLQGSVCNEGFIPNKSRICLTGLCHEVANCPGGWFCAKGSANDVLGLCGNGAMGAPCGTNADCQSGLHCSSPGPGFIGFCL